MRYAALILLAAGCEPADATNRVRVVPPPPAVPWADAMTPAAAGVNAFAFDLYGRLAGDPGNLFLSPFSVSTALAMTAEGAAGDTRAEMSKALHLPAAPAAGWGGLGRFYAAGGKPYELAVTNALWGQKGVAWKPAFQATLTEHYGAALTPLDFAADAGGSRGRINAAVAEATRGKITDLVGPADLSPLTRVVLTNAVYFKGNWVTQFPKGATKPAPFHRADGTKVDAPLMWVESGFRYAEADGVQLVELPYVGGELAMVVILPAKPDGLPAVEKKLTADWLARAVGGMKSERVEVFLPRFRSEARFDLGTKLEALGVKKAFDPAAADFSGMAAGEKIAVAKVIHKAWVDVNEEGTEAAAATFVGGNAPSPAPPQPKRFRADRPFAYLIRDVKNGTILFLGRLTSPN